MIKTSRLAALLFVTIFFFSGFSNPKATAQSGCDPVSIIGAWKLEPAFLEQLFGFDRIWSFSREGKVSIYVFDETAQDYLLVDEGDYSLDNNFHPTVLTISNLSLNTAFSGGNSFNFPILTLTNEYFEWVSMLGAVTKYTRVRSVTNPSFVGEPYRRVASRQELFEELLKSTTDTHESVYDHLRATAFTEFTDELGLKVEWLQVGKIAGNVLKITKLNPFKAAFDGLLVYIESEGGEYKYKVIYNRLLAFDDEICTEMTRLNERKIEELERKETVRVMYPLTYINPEFHENWYTIYYGIIDELDRLHSLRRRLRVELGLINAFGLQ